ncbi:hypothetical protein RF11_06746 [Thelohanellus kitauei]|uniref:Uncharacterized protein n=1 Tax=Thelohanellus kitauei TaxID=669202 RepID=A0A0C2IS73_THEKT|nr:hypothetical protein RF11_06746 [Thelohanellus kitauei]
MKVQETLFAMQYKDAAKTRLKLFRVDHRCHVMYSALVVKETSPLQSLYNDKRLPAIFYRLFTLHFYIERSVVPAQTNQRVLLEYSRLRQFNPESILTGFESIMINALHFVFPNVSKSVSITSRNAYTAKFKCWVHKLITKRKNSRFLFTFWLPLLSLLYQTRGYRRSHTFSSTKWNVNQRVVDYFPRTNDCVEGWHSGFQSSLLCTHPSLLKLLKQLKRENDLHRLTVVQLLCCQTYKPKRVYRIIDERIRNVVADYSNHTFMEFLRGVEHNLHL